MSTAGEIRVLHVDDDPSFADLSATFLEREHDRISVRTVTSPADGLRQLADHDVDCIVSDYDMPDTNGIEFLDAVREEHPELPFILYTGKGSEEIASDAISAGVTDYLQKESGSGHYAVLANRIGNVVERYRSRRAVQETERKLSELAERTDDILFMFDGDWSELLFINSAYEEIWGGSIDELAEDPRSFLELVHPEDRDDARASMERVLNGEPAQLEYRVVRPDGERRWVRGDTQPIQDGDGNRVRIVGQVRDITEQKERELHLETIIDNLPGYVYRHGYDSEYPLRFVKGDAEAVTGYTTTELAEEVVRAEEIIHPEDREGLWADNIEELEAVDQFDSTYRIITKDGDVRWIRDQGQLVEDPTTGEEVIDGFIIDVSDRIRREQEIRSQQLFIDESLDALQDIFYVVNEDGDLIRWNERVSAVSGYTDEEIAEMDATDFFAEKHRDRISENIEEIMRTGSSVVRAELLTAGGERRLFELRGTRLKESYRGETVAVGIGRDISEQVQRERELEVKNQRLDAILDNTTTPMFMKDDEGKYIFVNRRYRELFDLHDEPIAGRTDYDLHPPAVAEKVRENDQTVIENGEPLEVEEQILVDGEERVFLSPKVPIYDTGERSDPEEPVAVFGVANDITELRRREEQLQRERDRLDEFAGVVSHDIRNPLRIAEGRLELAREDCDSEHIDSIDRALTRIDTLTRDLLTLAREGDRMSESEPVGLAELSEQCWQNIETADATLQTSVDRTVQADRSRLAQLLENLVRNAVEHGGDDVTVTVGALADGFYVEDDGPGISGDDRDRAFEAGYSTAEDGTGFGLSIVKQVANAHDWDIRVTDGSDGNTRFEITGVEFT